MSLLSHSLQFMFLGLLLLMGCNPENKEQAKAEISSFSPIEGPRAGGVELTISGKNLQFTNQVTVGGNICTDLVVASSSTLKCMLPARAAGTANIVIRNLANSFTTASSPFTYLQGANVTSVSPVFGPTTGGTTVTITGTNLTAGSVVRIGGTLCSAPIFQADELQITCTTSARAPELNLSLTILDLNGDTTTYPLAFSYVSGPTIASVTPSSGRVEGFPTNPTITIAGFAFSPGATVTIDGNPCPTTSVATSSIVCQPPAGSPGGKVVRVTNPDALFGTRANGYTYIDAPTLTGILPINGPLGGGRTVTLTGTNFLPGMTIDLGGSACTSPIVLSTTSMTCVTGLRAIQGAVLGTVTNSFGQTANMAGAYNYRSPPDFTSVTPAQIGMSGGTISIVGVDLFDVGATDPTVLVNGQTCTGVVFDGINTITCTAPPLSPAPTTPLAVSIQILNPDGQTDTQAAALTYQPLPSIASITPSSGPLNAPQVVVITGTGFTATTTIDFLTAPVPGCTSYDYSLIPTQITCTIPAQGLGALTTVNVSSSIASPAQSTTITNGYSFRPAPGLTAITAPEGNPAGGYNRTINGTNFFNGASLQARIDGVACNTTDYVSPTQITCSGVPASILPLPAVTPVTVINGDGQASTGTVNFTYRLRPSISSVVQNQGPSINNLAAIPPIQRETLIINGVRFDDPGVTVTVGGVACVVNDGLSTATQIFCDVPDAPVMAPLPLTTPIIVTNTDGQVSAESFSYTYVGVATVTGVSPLAVAADDATGTSVVTITGTNFAAPITSITLAGVTCSTPTFVSATQVTCIVPNNLGVPARGDVVYTQDDGQVVTYSALEFSLRAAPVVTPATYTASANVTSSLVINGTGFEDYSVVDLVDGATVLSCPITAQTATQITCTIPVYATGGLFDVRVRNLASPLRESVLVDALTLFVDPTITSIAPFDRGRPGDSITITGTNFTGGSLQVSAVDFCAPATFVVVSATSITCTIDATTDGAKTLVYTNSVGRSVSTSYTILPQPTVTSIAPPIVKAAGGDVVTITGTGFVGSGWTVTIGSACTSVIVDSATQIRCTTGATAAGLYDATVSLAGTGLTGTGTNLLRYLAPATPSLVTPTSLLQSTAPTVISVFTAARFEAPVSVSLGGVACTAPTIISPTEVQCTAQSHPTGGPVTVSVTNGDGVVATATGLFTYVRAPTISGVAPVAGRFDGGTLNVILTGTDFINGATVEFRGPTVNAAATCTWNSATQITCTSPSPGADVNPTGQVAWDVRVTNPDGQIFTSSGAFTYQPAPLITSVAPAAFGPIAGGNTLTINGNYFYPSPIVRIDAFVCTVLTRTLTQITCTVPPAPGAVAGGPFDIRVTNADGQFAIASDNYFYYPAPSITSFNTTSFRKSGGDPLVITGSGFELGATVTIGGIPCVGISVDSNSQISCTTPAHALAGSKSVVITNLDSQTVTATNALLYFDAPTVTAITLNSGPTAGGQSVTINGTNFLPGMTVSIGGVACSSVIPSTSSVLTCTIGARVAGTVDVVATVLGEIGTLTNGFTYRAPPTVTAVLPTTGSTAGGTLITITGTNFAVGSIPRLQGTSCTSPTIVSATSITCTTPPRAAGAAAITVTNSDGQVSNATISFTYNSPPSVTSIAPTSGPVAGGTAVTITGTNFAGPATVTIGGVACGTPTVVSATSITCTTANLSTAGLKSVTVTNADGQAATLTNAFQAVAAPTVTSIFPTQALISGGITVSFTGTSFVSGAVAQINGVNCTSTTFVSSTRVDCLVPAIGGAVMDLPVTVINPDTQTGTLPLAFDYVDEAVLQWEVGAASPTPPNPDNFGSTSVNVSHTYTLRNVGTTTSGTITTSLTGSGSAAFTRFPTDNCNATTLAAGASCTMDVTFLGGVVGSGSYTATLRATAPASGTADNVIQGTKP